jgi:hypothetical protein
MKKSMFYSILYAMFFTVQILPAICYNQCYKEGCFEPTPLPATGYDFSQQFNEKRYWIESNIRTGKPQVCYQRLGLYPAFYQSDKIRCFPAQTTENPKNAPEGAHCWIADNVIVCQDEHGRVTVHHPHKK